MYKNKATFIMLSDEQFKKISEYVKQENITVKEYFNSLIQKDIAEREKTGD